MKRTFQLKALACLVATALFLVGCTKPVEVKDFDEALLAASLATNDTLLLVDFRADWCGPCRQMDPKIEAIAQCYSRDLRVARVDIGRQPDAARALNISGIPCLVFFKHGHERVRLTGNVACETIVEAVE